MKIKYLVLSAVTFLFYQNEVFSETYCAVPLLTPVTTCEDVMCTASGLHSPGDECDGDEDQQPYTYCTTVWENDGCLYYGGGSGTGSGSGGGTSGGGGSSNGDPNETPTFPEEEIEDSLSCGVDDFNDPMGGIGIIGRPDPNEPAPVICQNSFLSTITGCLHRKAITSTDDNVYKDMLGTFTDSSYQILFQTGQLNTPTQTSTNINNLTNTILGETTIKTLYGPSAPGDAHLLDDVTIFTITIDDRLNDGASLRRYSNLVREATIMHEVIHAYIFRELIEWGIIAYDHEGNGGLVNHGSGGIEIGPCQLAGIWNELVCDAMTLLENANLDPSNFEHEVYISAMYEGSTSYREVIENFILNHHDWDSEPSGLVSSMQAYFNVTDSSWKQKTAEYLSWIGMQDTVSFNNWLTAQGITEHQYVNDFMRTVRVTGNSTCTIP